MTMISKTRFSKKTLVRLLAAVLAVSGGGLVWAQEPLTRGDYGVGDYSVVARQDLQRVVAPVALYPDALLAQVLVASTFPRDVDAAAQFRRAGGDPLDGDAQGWDDSVKGLLREPDALYLLADNDDWMDQLGAAFLDQPADVMSAVQSVRARAYATGYLKSNQWQSVIDDREVVQIIPADPQVIYVPVYDPDVILDQRGAFGAFSAIRFGAGIEVGAWLEHDCDWHDHAVYVGNWGWHRPWWEHHDFDGRGHDRPINVYVNNRPGHYSGERDVTNIVTVRNTTNVRNVSNVINVTAHKWTPQAGARSANRQAAAPEPVRDRSVASDHQAGRSQPVVTARASGPRSTPAAAAKPAAVPAAVGRSAPALGRSHDSSASQRPLGRATPAVTVAKAQSPSPAPKTTTARPPAPSVRPATPAAKSTPARAPGPAVRSTSQPPRGAAPAAGKPAPAPAHKPSAAPTARSAAPGDEHAAGAVHSGRAR